MKILQLIWVDAAWHPVVVFTAQVFSERGADVKILYRFPEAQNRIPGSSDFGGKVQLYPSGHGRVGWRNQLAYMKFLIRAFCLARSFKPDLIIGYDMHGIVAATCAHVGHYQAQLMYHNLDLADKSGLRMYGRIIQRLELKAVQTADLTVFSSPGRALSFKQDVRLKREPLVVMNCQRRDDRMTKTGELERILRTKGLSFERLIVRLGSIGPHHAIEATIQSVPHWAGNWGLVLAGVPIPSYLVQLEKLVARLDLAQRVIILPSVPYDLWYDCLYAAHLGIALYELDGNVNHLSMAGAGNKLNLYLKAGIPCIVPNIADFVQFVENHHAAVMATSCEPAAIAAAVNTALTDMARYVDLCKNARLAFETKYNFEIQFAPVLGALELEANCHW